MKTIYKYTIVPQKEDISLPSGAVVLAVSFQGEDLCLWAEVDTEAELETRYFRIFGTGHRMCFEGTTSHMHIGTAFYEHHGLVFHVYEYTKIHWHDD